MYQNITIGGFALIIVNCRCLFFFAEERKQDSKEEHDSEDGNERKDPCVVVKPLLEYVDHSFIDVVYWILKSKPDTRVIHGEVEDSVYAVEKDRPKYDVLSLSTTVNSVIAHILIIFGDLFWLE